VTRTTEPFVRATVVSAERPTSAKPGDSAVIDAAGTIVGFVGGSCVETSVRVQALRSMATGESVLLRVTPDDTDADDRPGHVTAVNPCLSGGTLEIFLEPVLPPPLVGVVGDGPIARALAAVAEAAGFAVEPVDAGVTPGTAAVVVASHGRGEEAALAAALDAGVPYVGLVASRRRGAAVREALGVRGAAVHTPAGLDIGARSPGEVAVSILAEIVAGRPRTPVAAGAPPSAARAPQTAVDPVCGMEVVTGAATEHAEHAGRSYWFCGPGCRAAFVDAPARYCRPSSPSR
jgi:xanthine dehydrogenase accessory factor